MNSSGAEELNAVQNLLYASAREPETTTRGILPRKPALSKRALKPSRQALRSAFAVPPPST